MLPVYCICGGCNTLTDYVLPHADIIVHLHAQPIALQVQQLPVIKCNSCQRRMLDGSADGAIRWGLVIEGYLEPDEPYSHAIEELKCVLRR